MNEEINKVEYSDSRHFVACDDHKAKIKVVGVGGAGGNAVNRMVNMNIRDVEFIAINTDALALDNNLADEKIAIGQKTTKSLGAGAKPEVGREAVMEDKDTVEKKLEGADMVFISAGMGGGTGTGAAPVVAEIAKKLGILTVAVVTMPFRWEGPVRRKNAEKGLAALRTVVDSIIVINNQRLMDVIEKNTPMPEAFRKVDEVLANAVRSICDIMFIHGTINLDFNDARTVMSKGGSALMGTGVASGEDRALKAAQEAIACPLLDNVKVSGASGALINVAHGENFSMSEYNDALEYLFQQIGEENEPNIVAGDVTIPEMGDKVSITVIATGFDKDFDEDFVRPEAAKEKAPEAPKHVEQAIPRATVDFVALAHTETPAAATEEKSVQSPTMRTHVLKPVSANEEAPAPTESSPAAESFMSPAFNARTSSLVEEETGSFLTETPTVAMSKAPQAPVAEEKPASGEESLYGVPAFMRCNPISEEEF